VNLDDTHLRERDDTFDAVDGEVLADLGLLLDSDAAQNVGAPDLAMSACS
jgi:hypothetical protein